MKITNRKNVFRTVIGISILISLLICSANAVPIEQWNRTFGGSGFDDGYSVQQTADGGYIVTGRTPYYADTYNYGVYLIKTDVIGNKLWEKTLGESGSEGKSVQQTTDGGYIIVGITTSYGAGSYDVYTIKTDALGNNIWEKTFGGSSGDGGFSVRQTTDGGYIITGTTRSYGAGNDDVYLIKTDSSGNKLWENTFGGSGDDIGNSVQQTTDGGYIIVGITTSYGAGNDDIYLIKVDDLGNKLWENTFGGSGDDIGNSVRQTTDGGYIIVGYTDSGGMYLIKVDTLGNKLWENTFGGVGKSGQQTVDGGYIIAGYTYTTSYGASNEDVYLIKTDSSGNKLWDKTFGGSDYDIGNSVQQTADGGYIIVGVTTSYGAGSEDVYLIKVSDKPEIIYDFNGFFQPIDNLPMWNSIKAGSAVPVKFNLSGDQGLDIFETGYPASQNIGCDSDSPTDVIEDTTSAGSSGLSYSATIDQYSYVWKTDKAWKDSCRQLTILLKDGTYHNASFKLLK